jgi:hypothetical protein
MKEQETPSAVQPRLYSRLLWSLIEFFVVVIILLS